MVLESDSFSATQFARMNQRFVRMEKGVVLDYKAATALELITVQNQLPLRDDAAILEFFKSPNRVRILIQILCRIPFDRSYWPRMILSTVCSLEYLCERKFPAWS